MTLKTKQRRGEKNSNRKEKALFRQKKKDKEKKDERVNKVKKKQKIEKRARRNMSNIYTKGLKGGGEGKHHWTRVKKTSKFDIT